MNDLISRQALCEYALNQKDKSITPNDIMRFPSAQPDTDMVSRQLMHDLGATCIARRGEDDDLIPILNIDLLPPTSESNVISIIRHFTGHYGG